MTNKSKNEVVKNLKNDSDYGDKYESINKMHKGYYEFLKASKEKQRNSSDAPTLNKGQFDDSDYGAIFMTF